MAGSSPSTRWRRNADVLHRRLPMGVLLAPPGSGAPVEVSAPGDLVWDLLREPRTLEDLGALVTPRFAAPREQIRQDLARLIDDLHAKHLVTNDDDDGVAPTAIQPSEARALIDAGTFDSALDEGWRKEALATLDLGDSRASKGDRSERTPLDATAWERVMRTTRSGRHAGTLAWLVAIDGLAVTDEQRDAAQLVHRESMALVLTLERELTSLATDLNGRGIPFRVLKGSALARLDEVDPSLRAFGDIDLLVRPDDFERTEAALVERGGQRRFAQPRPGFDRRFSKGASYSFARNCEVDLHRTLAPGAFGLTIDLEELFGATEAFDIGGHELLALDRPSRFIHACYHAILGSAEPRVSTLRDLMHTAPRDDDEARLVLDRVGRWQGETVIALALQATTHRFGWTPITELDTWANRHRPSRRSSRWMAGYTGEDRSYARQMINAVEAVRGPLNKAAFVRAVVSPSPAPGRTRSTTRWKRGLRALLRRRPARNSRSVVREPHEVGLRHDRTEGDAG